MKYIFLLAGKGSRLQPLTFSSPKALYQLDDSTTLVQRMAGLLRKHDSGADIIAVTGYMHEDVERCLPGVKFRYNPFYGVTNSVASLWFARNELCCGSDVVLLNGDLVMSEALVRDVICSEVKNPSVLLDSSVKHGGDYNVEVLGNQVLVMSKDLTDYYGEYAGVTRLDSRSAGMLAEEVSLMVEGGFYDQWYENALVQMIFRGSFKLYFEDIAEYEWTEVDTVNDLLKARQIHVMEKNAKCE